MKARIGLAVLAGVLMWAVPVRFDGAMMGQSFNGSTSRWGGGTRGGHFQGGRSFGGFRGGTGFHRGFNGGRNWGWHRGGFGHDRDFHFRHHFDDDDDFFFVYSPPFYYPYPGYYYSYPPPYDYGGYYYSDPPPPATADNSNGYGNDPNSAAAEDAQKFYQAGHDWGQDLRRDVVPWDQFVGYVNDNLLNGTQAEQDAFRSGFVAGYGNHAQDAMDKAMQQASGQTRTKVMKAPPAGAY